MIIFGLGIPYSVPPVNSNRWKYLQTLKSANECWSGTLDGSEFGSACLQFDNWNDIIGSEDCLFLNVWARDPMQTCNPNQKKPVIMGIHGGSLVTNSGDFVSVLPIPIIRNPEYKFHCEIRLIHLSLSVKKIMFL